MAAYRWFGVLLVALAACGGDGDGGGSTPDAAAPDAEVDTGPTPGWFVASDIGVPTTSGQALSMALDIDGDSGKDNALGGLLVSLGSTLNVNFDLVTALSIASHDLVFLQWVDPDSLLGGGPTVVRLRRGSGAGPFEVVATDGDGDLTGDYADGALTAGPGTAPVPLAFSPGQEPIRLDAIGVRVEATITIEGWTDAAFGGAVPVEEIEQTLYPAMAEQFSALIAIDCPGQVCASGSSGESVQGFFDADDDYVVTAMEVGDNSLIASTIGNPDLDLLDANGDFNPDVDGIRDSLSFGFGLTAEPAAVAE